MVFHRINPRPLMGRGVAPPAVLVGWDDESLGRVVVYLRRQGVPVHAAGFSRDGGLWFSFEPHLAQARTLEGLLLTLPGVGTVEHVTPWLVRAGLGVPVPASGERRGLRRLLRS